MVTPGAILLVLGLVLLVSGLGALVSPRRAGRW